MTFKFITVLAMLSICSCAWHSESAVEPQQSSVMPNREEAVGFFSSVYKSMRDTERASYGMLYGIRDGMDSFIYDVQKDYYDDYQK